MNDLEELKKIADCFEFMPGSSGLHSQAELSALYLKHPIKDTVTFFGGSFNPFHEGHRECLDQCPEKNILIVPDRNPFKDVSLQNPAEEFFSLAEKLKETNYSLYPGFLLKTEKNPTSSWLPFVKLKEKNFLMGDDSFIDLPKWKNPEAIIKALTKLYVVPRHFKKDDYLLVEMELLKWNPSLEIHYLAEHPYMNLSSTSLRSIK